MGYRQAAVVFGVSERSVGTWWRAYRRDGRDGRATRKWRPGPVELVGPQDWGTLFAAMADYTPEELLIEPPPVQAAADSPMWWPLRGNLAGDRALLAHAEQVWLDHPRAPAGDARLLRAPLSSLVAT